MAAPIDPTFSQPWLEKKLSEIYYTGIGHILKDGNVELAQPYAKALAVFHYEGMTADEIEIAILEAVDNALPEE